MPCKYMSNTHLASHDYMVYKDYGYCCASLKLAWIIITKTRLFKYIENSTPKNCMFSNKNSDIFFQISAQDIECGYSLEPLQGGSIEYLQSMFLSRNKKNNVYPCKPQIYYKKKWGLWKSKLYRYVFVMLNVITVNPRYNDSICSEKCCHYNEFAALKNH